MGQNYHSHAHQQHQTMASDEDPNELLFAKIDNEQNEAVQSNENLNDNYQKSRYNRQYVVRHANSAQFEYENNDNSVQYELSSNFQTMTTAANQNQSRRRRSRQNASKNATNQKYKNQKKSASNSNKSNSNSPQQTFKNDKKNNRKNKQSVPAKKKNLNVVTIACSKSPQVAVGINWAAQLKGSAKPKKASLSSSSSIELDSSQRACMDAEKVRHVLEVFNMTPADYQRVSSIFKHFKIDSFINSLICVKKRWFVVFDCAKSAVRALNVVKNDRFKLKRIDLNVRDVQMLKNNVPPPLRSK